METKKLCPHCKMEVDPKATKCPHCHGKINDWSSWSKKKKIFVGVVAVLFLGSVIYSSQTETTTPSVQVSSSTSESLPRIGDNAFIQVPNASPNSSPVFYTQSDLDQYIKAAVAHDTYGMAEVIQNGGGFFVNNGTRVLIIDKSMTETKFRILSGEHQGDSAWLPKEFLKK